MSLKVRAIPTSHVPVFEAFQAMPKRFVGKKFDESVSNWVVVDDVFEVAETAEYRAAVRDGDLIPADKETADKCQVTFVVDHDALKSE